jgi:two-component system response regulator
VRRDNLCCKNLSLWRESTNCEQFALSKAYSVARAQSTSPLQLFPSFPRGMKKLNILLIEDNLDHARLIQLILDRKNVRAHVQVARDGVEAMSLLTHTGLSPSPKRAARPDLILLDLNMPRVDGRELLRQVKSTHTLKDIPVVVLSTSEKAEDRIYAAREGAAAYLGKSLGFDAFSQMLSEVIDLPALRNMKS